MSRVPIWASVTVWAIKPFFISPRRDRRAEMRKYVAKGRPVLAGDGAWKRHYVINSLSFTAVCDQPVGSVGGDRADVDCRACKRLMRRWRRG